jgi:hypothetical protein
MIAPPLSHRSFSTAVHWPELGMVEPRATARLPHARLKISIRLNVVHTGTMADKN